MQKKFFSNLVLIVFLNLLIKPIAIFGIDATVQNRVSTNDYGMYFALLNLSFLFNIIMDIGINNFTTKSIAQHPKIASKYINKLFSFRLILFVLYAFITMLVGFSIGYRDNALYLLLVLVFNQWIVMLIAYFRSHFGGLHLFKTDALVSVLDRALLILFCGIILFSTNAGKHFQIEWFIWIQTTCYLITLIVAFIMLVRQIGVPKFTFHWVFSLAILRKSYPYALLILLMMIYTRTDSVMLERLHSNGTYEAGVYAQGFRLLDAFFMFGMIFANLLLPIFARLIKQKSTALSPLLIAARNLLVGGAILVAFTCFYHAEWLLNLLYDKDVSASAASFKFLMLAFIGMCVSLIYGTLLTAKGDLRFLNQISVVGILLNVIFNALLIPKYGASGSAFATLVTQGFTALIQLIYAHKKLSIPFPVTQLAQFLGFVLLFVAMHYFIPELDSKIYIELALGIAGLFAFKMIHIKQLKMAFRGNE